MLKVGMGVLWTCAALLALASAGPLHRFPRESDDYQNIDFSAYANYTANEMCFLDNEVFQKGDLMPNPGPCEECRCEPPSIVCNMIKCPVNNNGCRTIQRANHCCPDYNCECDYNGQLYNDGERLELPEEPCRVCYCKGGEVMCTSITCYQRDDCEPIHVPGQCCPKYENCPIRDMASSNYDGKNPRSSNKTINNPPKREMQPWLLTKSVHQASSVSVPQRPDAADDTTTQGNNIIIVSDWLSERRTTTEDGENNDGTRHDFDHTDEPIIVTNPNYLTTTEQRNVNTPTAEGNNLTRNSETITPLDEVIFTRIDTMREHEQDNSEPPTSSSNIFEETSTTILPKSFNEKTGPVSKLTSTITKQATSTPPTLSTAEDVVRLPIKYSNSEESENQTHPFTSSTTKHESGTISEIAGSTELGSTNFHLIDKNEKDLENMEKVKITPDFDSTTQQILNQGSTNVFNENVDTLIDHVSIYSREDVAENTDVNLDIVEQSKNIESSKEITLEQLFGLDGSTPEHVTTTNNPTIVQTNDIVIMFENDKKNNVWSKTTVEQQETERNETYTVLANLSDNSIQDKSNNIPVTVKSQESSSYDTNDKLVIKGNFENTPAITENTHIAEENTTPYILTEDHNNNINLSSIKTVKEHNKREGGMKYNDESTKESVKSIMANEFESLTFNGEKMMKKNYPPHEMDVQSNTNSNLAREDGYTEIDDSTTVVPNEFSDMQATKDSIINLQVKYKTEDVLNDGIAINTTLYSEKTPVLDYDESATYTTSTSESVVYREEEKNSENVLQTIELAPESITGDEEILLDQQKDHLFHSNGEALANFPPVLELNSHVPFLQLGGHGSSDSPLDPVEDDDQTKIPSVYETLSGINEKYVYENEQTANPTTITVPSSHSEKGSYDYLVTFYPTSGTDEANTNKAIVTGDTKDDGNNDDTEIGTTSLIPLTPGDLKALAEYLINEKIRPVTSENDSAYAENQWLKGNITSEEKLASIFSAANISIGIMNRSESEGKSLESSTKPNEIIEINKVDKETLIKENSILQNGNKFLNKTGFQRNKYMGNQDFFKDIPIPQITINDGKNIDSIISTETNLHKVHTLTEKINKNEDIEHNFENKGKKSLKTAKISDNTPTEFSNDMLIQNYDQETSSVIGNQKNYDGILIALNDTSQSTSSHNSDHKINQDLPVEKTNTLDTNQSTRLEVTTRNVDIVKNNNEFNSTVLDDVTVPEDVLQNHTVIP